MPDIRAKDGLRLLLRSHQLRARHPHVAQREQRDELRRVLRQSAVPPLGEPELPLDHTERDTYANQSLGVCLLKGGTRCREVILEL